MRVAQLLICPVFLYFAYLQFNDPDAARWTLAYALVSLNCLAAFFGKSNVVTSAGLTLVLVTWATILSMSVSGQLLAPGVNLVESEEARELGGLLVAAIWCAITAAHASRVRWRGDQ